MCFPYNFGGRRSGRAIGLSLLLFALATARLWCQSSLTGLVSDPSGAVVANAQIQTRNLNTNINRVAATNDKGYYTITGLTPGTYQVQVDATGFNSLTRAGVILGEDQDLRLDLALALGTEKTVVQVNTQAPALQQETTDVSTSLEQNAIQTLPLNGRNITSLVAL